MLILGLETSCDETAAALVDHGDLVLSSVVASQNEIHAEYAGVVPELASRAHVERILPVVREALVQAGMGLGMIDAVAVGSRPGLIGSLLIGVSAAKALAWSLGKPLVGVDHVHAHLYSGVLTEDRSQGKDSPVFPALGLIVSGGHTSMYRLESWTQLTRLGATIDDAVGEAYDKAATILGIPFPGGPNLDRLAQSAADAPERIELPVSRLGKTSLDFSFSGLKTSLLYAVKGVPHERAGVSPPPPPPPMDDARRQMLAAAFQRAAIDAVMLKLERAWEQAEHRGQPYTSLVTGGGVTANSRLRKELQSFGVRRRLPLFLPPMHLCVDNAAMIAGLAWQKLRAGAPDTLALQAVPTTSC